MSFKAMALLTRRLAIYENKYLHLRNFRENIIYRVFRTKIPDFTEFLLKIVKLIFINFRTVVSIFLK